MTMSINNNIYPKVEINRSGVKREKMFYKKKKKNRFKIVLCKILQLHAQVAQDGNIGHWYNKRC